MSENRVLLKGGRVISMDSSVGDLSQGDVLIEDGKVAGVSEAIEAPDAEVFDASNMIVLPGFVDTHRHTWQSAIKGMSIGLVASRVSGRNPGEDRAPLHSRRRICRHPLRGD